MFGAALSDNYSRPLRKFYRTFVFALVSKPTAILIFLTISICSNPMMQTTDPGPRPYTASTGAFL